MKEVTDMMETAAATADFSRARQSLVDSMEKLREGLAAPSPLDHSLGTGNVMCLNSYFNILHSFFTIIFVCMYMYVFVCLYCMCVCVCLYVCVHGYVEML